MPEFEESSTSPSPDNSYTPGSNTPANTGGRRRSGGFKTEVPERSSNIGEVDPSEALKSRSLKEMSMAANRPENHGTATERKPATSNKKDASMDGRGSSDKKPSKAQPSKATLKAIREAEARIASRRAESEKDRPIKETTAKRSPEKNGKKPGSERRSQARGGNVRKGGFLMAIARFLGKLFGSRKSKSAAKHQNNKPSGNQRRRNNSQKSGNPQQRRDSGNRSRGRRRGQGGQGPRNNQQRNNQQRNPGKPSGRNAS